MEDRSTAMTSRFLEGQEFELQLRDHLFLLDLSLDIPAQLFAIRELLGQHVQSSTAFLKEIERIEKRTKQLAEDSDQRAVEEWLERVRHSVYQSAAHSMAAVGMLAPFVESLFYESFLAIGRRFFQPPSTLPSHSRWDAMNVVQWDCHFVVEASRAPQKDLVRGIVQLAEAIALRPFLPHDLPRTLSGLFGYRNKMFHSGFEWPPAERARFAKRMADEHWPEDWFSQSTSGGEPWIYYMSQIFIDHCLEVIEKVLDGLSAFVKQELVPKIR